MFSNLSVELCVKEPGIKSNLFWRLYIFFFFFPALFSLLNFRSTAITLQVDLRVKRPFDKRPPNTAILIKHRWRRPQGNEVCVNFKSLYFPGQKKTATEMYVKFV